MTAVPENRAPRRPDPRAGRIGLEDTIGETALLLGAGSAVMNQLALLGVGRGVARHSTTLDRPLDRLRTTLTYLYGLGMGTDEERRAIARMVNRAHVPVRGEGYNAFDADLQLWVAATLAAGGEQIYEKTFGPLDPDSRERLYRDSWIFGTTLQVTEEMWPPTRAEFEEYWARVEAELEVDDEVRAYARKLLTPRADQWYLAPFVLLQNLLTRGNLSPRVREVLGLPWTPADQRRYDRFWRVWRQVYPRLPRAVRTAYPRYVLRDFRRRMAAGRRVI